MGTAARVVHVEPPRVVDRVACLRVGRGEADAADRLFGTIRWARRRIDAAQQYHQGQQAHD